MSSPTRASLMTAGFDVRELPLYVTGPVPADDLPETPCGPDEIVFFCSPSTVKAFTAAWDARPRCVAIGRPTAEAATKAGFPVDVADQPDLESMVLAAGLDPDNLPESDPSKMDFSSGSSKPKSWKEIWGSGQGINAVTGFQLDPWAAYTEDDVRDINGRNRDYLLTGWARHTCGLP